MHPTPPHHPAIPAPPNPRAILLLAASLALMTTGYGLIIPVFGKRLGEIGSGVDVLGLMTMAFALAQLLLAPVLGGLADRYGRRPIILLALLGYAASNVAFLLVDTPGAFIAIRLVEGGLTAGLLPAAMGVVADTMPEEQRARWSGVVMGGYSLGIIFGPAAGGVLYELWGFAAPFTISAALAVLGALLIAALVPETRPDPATLPKPTGPPPREGLLDSLPRPLLVLGTLLLLDFLALFVFTFIEPLMVFYFYQELGLTPFEFGLIISGYGLTMTIGQATCGGLSDRFGRPPMIALGFLLNVAFYAGLIFLRDFIPLLVVALIAGLGEALITPALSAAYLDLADEKHRSRVMGLEESAASLGGVVGPLLIALIGPSANPKAIFATSAILPALAAILALVALRRKPIAGAPQPPA